MEENKEFDITSFKEGYVSATISSKCGTENMFFFDVEEADPTRLMNRAFSFACVDKVAFHKAEPNPECLVMTVTLDKDKCSKNKPAENPVNNIALKQAARTINQ